VGAAVAVYVDGVPVVDLHGGWADQPTARPWAPDTLVNVYSVGKAIVALLLLREVEAGILGLDDPVVELWPEFGAAGKDGTTVRHALCHRAGVPAIRERLVDLDLVDWPTMTSALAATAPWWEPGTRHAYHTNTYGHLVGELLHRATGTLPGEVLAALAGPLDADVHFGVADADLDRCATVEFVTSGRVPVLDDDVFVPGNRPDDERMVALSYFNPPGYSSVGVVNTAAWRRTQIPSTNGHATALGVARIYRALLEPVGLLGSELLTEATSVQSRGWCPVLGEEAAFGLGFTPTASHRPIGPNPRTFGHFGTGGALGFADPDAGVAFGYVMNHVIPRWRSTRNRALVDAVYDSL
jgi:CubicO group peptidase (beta-lactamase class C family)